MAWRSRYSPRRFLKGTCSSQLSTPPSFGPFSQRMTLWPRLTAVRAASMPPTPPPATSTVFFSFTGGMARYSSSWPTSGLMAQ